MYKYLFGPVPSRRLGMSLGVDLVPRKVCTLDCVYCEVGKTTRLTTERKEYILFKSIKEELNHFFENSPDPDYFTFSGSGEPTLNSKIGDVLQFIKHKKPKIPVAVLTNGTLLRNKSVRDEINDADVVLPSLDAASQEVFDRINRPHSSLSIDEHIEGLINFRNEYKGKIWLEILILPDYNNHKDELNKLRQAIIKINPDSVQLNTLDRPGNVKGLRGATIEELQSIVDFWELDNVEIIAKHKSSKDTKAYRTNIESAILDTIARRPCTLEDLSKVLGLHINEINKYLNQLSGEGKIISQNLDRGAFYFINEDSISN
jgi:wyosine [tRNA(Phe)-imidazoG37] synthetase (radical SAM superfamily)